MQDFDERFRRIAFRIGLLGLGVVLAAFLMSAFTGTLTSESVAEASTYAIILSGIAIAGHFDFRVRHVLHGGLVALFFAYWGFSANEFLTGQTQLNSLHFALFIPAFIAIGMDYRLQFALAPIQGVMVFQCFSYYGPLFFGEHLSATQLNWLGLTIAVLSAAMFALLGVVQLARQATDARLTNVINEKDWLASTDPLTGLLNRRAFVESLKTTAQSSDSMTLLFIDLNNFKPLNDQYGHAAGDAVLKAIAARLTRNPDVTHAARPGGDEFAASLHPELSPAETDNAVARLHAELVQDVCWNDQLISVGASIGYAQESTERYSTSQCLAEADAAMRRCKAVDGGYARFTPELDGNTIQTEVLSVTFPRALSSGIIRPALQPIVDTGTLEIVSYELLSRWVDPTQDEQPGPNDFIPVAEKLGLTVSIRPSRSR